MDEDTGYYERIVRDTIDKVRGDTAGIHIVSVDDTHRSFTHRSVKRSEFKEAFPYYSSMTQISRKWLTDLIRRDDNVWVVTVEKPNRGGIFMSVAHL